jgi:hypothetical protein
VIPVVTSIFGAAYAVQPGYGIGFSKDVYLWIPVLGNILAVLVIPFVGNLSDKIGRKPPIIVGAIGTGLMSFGYLYAISIHSVPLAILMSLLMWGVVYQGYNAVFPSFYPRASRSDRHPDDDRLDHARCHAGGGAGVLERARDLSRSHERSRQPQRGAGAEGGVRPPAAGDAGRGLSPFEIPRATRRQPCPELPRPVTNS